MTSDSSREDQADVRETPRDEDTIAYFDDHAPEYSVERLARAADMIIKDGPSDAALVDIGCGAGNTLAYLRGATGLRTLAGIDVSKRLLERTRERVDCETHLGSILDADLVQRLQGRFEYAVVAAVLHHLIGRTRRESREHATLAIHNSLRLLKPGGLLIIVEPLFGPPLAMDAVFWIKKGLTRVTSKRVSFFGTWNNLGPPVVSYYTREQLLRMIDSAAGAQRVELEVLPGHLPPLLRPILRRADLTAAIRKTA
jgi:SAM-dependent methyltransferase